MTQFNIVRNAKNWKAYVEQTLLTQADQHVALADRHATLANQHAALADQHAKLLDQHTTLTGSLNEFAAQLQSLADKAADLTTLRADVRALSSTLMAHQQTGLAEISQRSEERGRSSDRLLALSFQRRASALLGRHPDLSKALANGCGILFLRRGAQLLLLLVSADSPVARYVDGMEPASLIEAVLLSTVEQAFIIAPRMLGGPSVEPADGLIEAIRDRPIDALAWAREASATARSIRSLQIASAGTDPEYFERLEHLIDNLSAIDFFANETPSRPGEPAVSNAPFSEPDLLAGIMPAQPKRRSVLFPHHCYYNFYYLARALRARGWDALSVSLEAPDSAHRNFYHGEDETIYDPDPVVHRRRVSSFLRDNADRFDVIHTYGVGALSLFPLNHDRGPEQPGIPWDILEAKRRGVLIGYSHSGCLDAVSQTSFRQWSPSMCSNCVWESNPAVCSDSRNLFWGRKLTTIVDLFCTETDPPLDYKGAPQAFRAPLTFAMDPNVWRPDIEIPETYRRDRRPGEVLVYHAMGNYETRSREGRNVKGTGAVIAAVEKLRAEGLDIRLDFVHDVPSLDNRFVQVQADIIVDQLHYGRYGALAREGMLLGKPVVGRVEKNDGPELAATRCIQETPIVHADESSIAAVLRDLALHPEKRAAIGAASRQHAIEWWSADRLAARFEQVYDHLREHGRPPAEEDVL